MKTQVNGTRSEFGKGLAYCLGLFLAHADRLRSEKQTYKHSDHESIAKELGATYSMIEVERWFSGAAEHLRVTGYCCAKGVARTPQEVSGQVCELGSGFRAK